MSFDDGSLAAAAVDPFTTKSTTDDLDISLYFLLEAAVLSSLIMSVSRIKVRQTASSVIILFQTAEDIQNKILHFISVSLQLLVRCHTQHIC